MLLLCRSIVARQAGDDVLRLVFRNAKHRLELARLHDAREQTAGVDVLAELERRIAECSGAGRLRAT